MKKVGVHNRKQKAIFSTFETLFRFIGLKFRDNLTLNIHNLMNNNLYHIIYFNCYFRVFRHVLLSFCWFPTRSARRNICENCSSILIILKHSGVGYFLGSYCLSVYLSACSSVCLYVCYLLSENGLSVKIFLLVLMTFHIQPCC